jgi:protein-L-isoaspartate(D-aspartate) O-methyltransferase
VLAELVRAVYTIEIIEPLGEQARQRLKRLGYGNVEVRIGMAITAGKNTGRSTASWSRRRRATSCRPPAAPAQARRPHGHSRRERLPTQQLMLVEKGQDGAIKTRQLLPVAFVPLTGKHR